MTKHTATWKAHERRTADRLGGKQLGAIGKENEDVSTSKLAIECKHRQSLPAWLSTALAKVKTHARRQGKTGLVVIHGLGKHDSLILMSFSAFARLMNDQEFAGIFRPEQQETARISKPDDILDALATEDSNVLDAMTD